MPNHWLFKSEPGSYSIADLERDGSTHWDGVRNFQARNYLRDQMKVGDRVIFYHSNAAPPAAVGVAEICREGYPDPTALDPADSHYDPKSTPENPIWMMVDIRFVSAFARPVSLDEIKADPQLAGALVAKPGNRLSVMPVSQEHFKRLVELGSTHA